MRASNRSEDEIPEGTALPEFPPFSADLPIYASTLAAQKAGLLVPIALVVRVVDLYETEIIDHQPHRRLRLKDQADSEAIETLPVGDLDLVEQALCALRDGSHLVCYGCLVPHGRPRPGATGVPSRLHLHSLHPVPRPSALFGAMPAELAEAATTFARLTAPSDGPDGPDRPADPGALYRHLCQEALSLQGVVPVWSARFAACVKLVVLQALSQGQVSTGINPRLSMALVSDPGKGKRLLTQLACQLAPVSSTVQPTQFSLAGIAAQVQQRAGSGWVATPGAIPQASGGVCVFEDIHHIPKKDLNTTQGILMNTLEDGLVCPLKAAAASYDARCGVLLNGNPESVVRGKSRPKGVEKRLKEYGFSLDLYTRLDCAVHVDSTDDPAKAAREIAMQGARDKTPEEKQQDKERERRLKVLVAYILDRIPQVDTGPVKEQIGLLVDDLVVVLRQLTAKLVGEERYEMDGDMFLRRMANSVKKLVGASARLEGRAVATVADVELAWTMMAFKLEHIRWLCGEAQRVAPLGQREAMVERAEEQATQRFEEILARFGGQPGVQIETVAEATGCGVKVVRRELRKRGIRPSAGRYHIPTEPAYAAAQEAAAIAQAKAAAEAGVQAAAAAAVRGATAAPDGMAEVLQSQWFWDGHGAGPGVEDELEYEPLPELHEKERRPRFKDCLPDLPVACRPILDLLGRIQGLDQEDATMCLLDVAVKERHPFLYQDLVGLQAYMNSETLPPWSSGVIEEWVQWVMQPDREGRGLAALATYVNSDLEDQAELIWGWLQDKPDLPEKIREGLRAVVYRLDIHAGRDPKRKTFEERIKETEALLAARAQAREANPPSWPQPQPRSGNTS